LVDVFHGISAFRRDSRRCKARVGGVRASRVGAGWQKHLNKFDGIAGAVRGGTVKSVEAVVAEPTC
jgi:hypothetical protein